MKEASGERLTIDVRWQPGDYVETMAREVEQGLRQSPKTLPSKYFYDDRGSDLFEEITRLPEYYQSRTEQAILELIAPELMAGGEFHELLEIGSGSSTKTRTLLDAMTASGSRTRYVPLDISEETLRESARRLVARYPTLEVHGVVADFTEHLGQVPTAKDRRLAIFLGSTIGNLDRDERVSFLREVRGLLGPNDRFLLGLDLVKDVTRLEAAYNDSAGVTAEFNRNVLRVINRQLDGNFVVETFEHRAFYNRSEARIEMHLVAKERQEVELLKARLTLELSTGDDIRTEISCKFTRESADDMLSQAGMRLERWFTDPENLFALALATTAER
ncbi:MAG TPA: L-histidine N(alpha)-methyltransferase [Chloroflexota bacterium]